MERHEAIEELLAGYVLRALAGEDAREADRLLSEHVPTCARCRDTLSGFQQVAGDLALEVPPVAPPDLLLPTLHRDLGGRAARRRPSLLFTAAASFVVMVGLGAFALTQGMRANDLTQQATLLSKAADLSHQPGASQVAVGQVTSVFRPGLEDFYLQGSHVPQPAPGTVYHVWARVGTTYRHLGVFRPENGIVIIELRLDPSTFDEIIISEQPAAVTGGVPQNVRWRASV